MALSIMKTKFLFSILFAFLFASSITSCTNTFYSFNSEDAEESVANTVKSPQKKDYFSSLVSWKDVQEISKAPPANTDEVQEQLAESTDNWFYGPGVGRTMLNVGSIIVFPPYALYLLGNAGLTFAGYDPVYVTDALPEEPREKVLSVYDNVTSVPGKINAGIADREFHTE